MSYLEITLVSFIVLLIQYIVLMGLLVKYGEQGWLKPLFYIFVVEDWVVNWLLSPIFLELPAEFFELVTGRMKRYRKLKPSTRIQKWRLAFANWLCRILNEHERPGRIHC